MSKSKKISTKAYMEKLQRLIAKDIEEKDFNSIEEMNSYIRENYIEKEIIFDDKEQSPKEKAMDLIYEAWGIDNTKKIISLAKKAIELDENCADAYTILARFSAKTPEESLELFAKGMEAGKKSLGEDFEKFKGNFWGFQVTRPFMRAMEGYSDVLWVLGENSKSIQVKKEMLLLNPNDNQGVRHVLISRLLIQNRLLEAEKLYEEYKDDASAQWYYSKAYLYFNKRSKKLFADNALKEAMEYNPYVPLYLLGLIDMPDEDIDYTGMGDLNEAIDYVEDAIELWANDEKSLIWFINIYNKMEHELDMLIEKRENEGI